jgi:hypothetical protein
VFFSKEGGGAEVASDRPDAVKGTSRRKALQKMVMGAGAATVFPILGQGPVQAAEPPASRRTQADSSARQQDGDWEPLFFDPHQNQTVIALTDLIIPETDTPGAKAALVNQVIDRFLNDEEADAQRNFLEGLAWIDGRSLKLHGKPFIALSLEEQTALLTSLADPKNTNPEDKPGIKFFEEIKDATIFGYYTSQIGLEQELHYSGDTYNESFPGACTHPEHQT